MMALTQLNDLLSDTCKTGQMWLGDGASLELEKRLAALPDRRCLVVADITTWEVAGSDIHGQVMKRGHEVYRHLIETSHKTGKPSCDDEAVSNTLEQIRTVDASLVIAVGAGTVNDVTKLAAFHADRPYLVIPTAPSMNGYTSSTAAVMSSGVKESVPCRGPIACLADIQILRQAPYRMIAAGLGDLLSRSVSLADWYLSHRLSGTEFSAETTALVEESGRLCDGLASELPNRDPIAIARLMTALLISGEAMAQAGSSAPASGAEHLISHYLDMTRSPSDPGDLHGCQVGVATITTAAFYERLLALEPDVDLAPTALIAAIPAWNEVQRSLREHFGELATALRPQSRHKHLPAGQLSERLMRLRSEWNSIRHGLTPLLRPSASVRDQLQAAEAPISFSAIGVDAARARDAVLHGRHIRARYTILDLAAEIGLLERWGEELVIR